MRFLLFFLLLSNFAIANCPEISDFSGTYTILEDINLKIKAPKGLKVYDVNSKVTRIIQMKKDPATYHKFKDSLPKEFRLNFSIYKKEKSQEKMEKHLAKRLKKDSYQSAGELTINGRKTQVLEKSYRSGTKGLYFYVKKNDNYQAINAQLKTISKKKDCEDKNIEYLKKIITN